MASWTVGRLIGRLPALVVPGLLSGGIASLDDVFLWRSCLRLLHAPTALSDRLRRQYARALSRLHWGDARDAHLALDLAGASHVLARIGCERPNSQHAGSGLADWCVGESASAARPKDECSAAWRSLATHETCHLKPRTWTPRWTPPGRRAKPHLLALRTSAARIPSRRNREVPTARAVTRPRCRR